MKINEIEYTIATNHGKRKENKCKMVKRPFVKWMARVDHNGLRLENLLNVFCPFIFVLRTISNVCN